MVKLALRRKPPQPDPLNQATLQANINYTQRTRKKAMADAMKVKAEAQRRCESVRTQIGRRCLD